MVCDLLPRYDNVKSFYGKAQVITSNDDKIILLKSYNTIVGKLEGGKFSYFYKAHKGATSSTTLRHIKEFLKQNNLQVFSKKDLIKNYGVLEG